ncbi:hypothetical protein TRICI_001689 [Trichomonascus ciferrii]|uniref:Uncharacterized protein n=1 Tax=Trichomonascus ciferrii TaxID=44093 RepID=A0A642V8N7_9ASCO|nr:hypothetical protein TRICI_001689 [Trichomonascus ciferrii]
MPWLARGFECAGYQKKKYSYHCDSGDNETIHHIIIDCPIRKHLGQGLRAISDIMDLSVLLDTTLGLKATAEFIQNMPKHIRNKLRTARNQRKALVIGSSQ